MISLTSGTTGRPVGIVLDHSALVMRAFGYSLEGSYDRARFKRVSTLVFGNAQSHFGAFAARFDDYIQAPLFSASELIDWVLTERASFAFMVEASVRASSPRLPPPADRCSRIFRFFIAVALACWLRTRLRRPSA